MEEKGHSRRKFVHTCLSLGSVFLGSVLLINCRGKNESSSEKKGNKKQSSSKDPCNDLTAISTEEIKKRESLGYVLKSASLDTTCGNCGLYIPPKPDNNCGGCILFKGPVYKEGHCVQWAAITS